AAAWTAAGIARGRLPLPSARPAAWAAALALLSLASALASPARAYALPAWAWSAAGLWLVPAATLLSARDRVRVEQAVRAAAWAAVLLAVHQRFHGDLRPTAMFTNQNVFAGAILLLLPFAARRGDPLLAAGLLVCLWWTRSVGAWLGLSVALVLHRRAVGAFAFWVGAVAGFAGLVAAYAKLQSPEALHRWEWWEAAWRMACAAPFAGLGPGTFAYALPAFAPTRPDLSSLYAHQHVLETAAERGWPYLLVWAGGLAALLRRAEPGKRFGPVAALAHGLVDYPLSVPGVFWLFCLSAAWSQPESESAVSVPSRRKVPAIVVASALAAAAIHRVGSDWAADRLRARAAAGSDLPRAEADRLLASSEELRPHPEAARARAELALAAGGVEAAASHLERAVALDPYRASNWTLLEEAYRRLGRPVDAEEARARGARTRPAPRGEAR
ncbi:MAG: hypothetical protein HY079_08665, partial [Elusimicrobia bacterium]|nr:hypothetical protein [Elusimicrobiota bacterium]